MTPPRVKKEEDVAKAIEVLDEEIRDLEKIEGPGNGLPDSYNVTALKRLLTGGIRDHIEFKEPELQTYAKIREEVVRWANQRRLEKSQEFGDPMDIGQIALASDAKTEDQDWSGQDEWEWQEQ